MGNPIYSCTAMMMPQAAMAPDPMQQMAATQHALINQQALLMVRSSASFSFSSFQQFIELYCCCVLVPLGSADDYAGNESVSAADTAREAKEG